uniref:Uncharacterized protein n=1 Tax=Plectus sambesii TaxID=2011161 RepID=A0A914XNQ4_9BILA
MDSYDYGSGGAYGYGNNSPIDYGLYENNDFNYDYVSPVQSERVYPSQFSSYELPETNRYQPSTSYGTPSALAPHDNPYVTTSQLEYVPKTSPRNGTAAWPSNPSGSQHAAPSHVAFYGETTSREHFVWNTPIITESYKPQQTTYTQRADVPFYAETTSREHYVWNTPIATESYKPQQLSTFGSDIPFYGETTSRSDYGPKAIERSTRYSPVQRNEEVAQSIPFFGDTTHRSDYGPKTADRQTSFRQGIWIKLKTAPFSTENGPLRVVD